MVGANELFKAAIVICLFQGHVFAAGTGSFISMVEDHTEIVLFIALSVIIVLQILMIFFLQSINEHLNWIRRIR